MPDLSVSLRSTLVSRLSVVVIVIAVIVVGLLQVRRGRGGG